MRNHATCPSTFLTYLYKFLQPNEQRDKTSPCIALDNRPVTSAFKTILPFIHPVNTHIRLHRPISVPLPTQLGCLLFPVSFEKGRQTALGISRFYCPPSRPTCCYRVHSSRAKERSPSCENVLLVCAWLVLSKTGPFFCTSL